MDLRDYINNEVEIKINNQMHGIEIRFVNQMTEEQIIQIKEAGFRWSKRQQMWYAYQDEKTIEYVKSLESSYEEKQNIKTENISQDFNNEKTAYLEDLIAELRNEIRLQNERIKQLENTIQEQENNDEYIIESSTNEINFVNSIVLGEENRFTEEIVEEEINQPIENEESEITLYEEELELCKKVIPPNQYSYTLELAQGEEGNFYKQKLKDIALTVKKITTDEELVNPDGTHNVGFHYFVGNTDIYISEISSDGYAFGYTILNGDVQMSEWGYQNLEDILHARQWIEMDYHVEPGMTIERMLEEKYPEYFKQENEIEIETDNIIHSKENIFHSGFNALHTVNEKYAMEFEHAEEGKIEVNSEADKWIVKFYDISKVIPGNLIDKGRFIQSYYASSLLQNQNSNVGLNLGYGWSLDAKTFNRAKEIIKDFVSIDMSEIFSSKQNKTQQEKTKIENDKEYARELELELQEELKKESEPVYTIDGIEYSASEIEAGLREDIRQIFQEYDSGENVENLVLNDVKLYQVPEADNELHLLVEFESKNTENKWREDSLFNALSNENISFAGMKVDINPITPEKSGTIEEYFDKLNSIINENLFESEVNKVFNAVTNEFSEKYKGFYTSYDEIKQKQIENNSRYVGDDRIRNQFEQAHTEMLNLREAELKEIIKQSSTEEIAIKAATRYINYYGNLEGELASSNLYLQTRLAHYENGNLIYPSSDEVKNYIVKEYHENTEQLKSIIQEPTTKKDIKQIREQCEEILQKPDNEISAEEKLILAQYEGAGGINIEDRTSAQVLSEFYTPNNVIEKVWDIVDAYNPNGITVLEPTAGTGKFANNRPNNQFTMHELDETSARINKILHPGATVIQGAYQKQFLDENERIVNTDYEQPKYDIVIGNPPYGEYSGKYKNLEGKHHNRYEEYFIEKGLDALKDEKSLLAFVVPSGFLDSKSDKVKEIIGSKGILLDAYRLPAGTFSTTDVGTDIIVMKPWTWTKAEIVSKEEMAKVYADEMSNNDWFKKHPEKILGEVIQTTNQFGKLVDKVVCHEGLSIQDELNKIDFFIKDINIKKIVENNKEEQNQILDVEQLEIVQDKEKVTSKKTQKNTEQKTEEIKEKVLAPVMTSEEFAKLYGKDFKAEELPIWRATNWEGIIDTTKLSFEEENLLHESDNYVEIEPRQFTHKVLFESGDIGSKITRYQNLIENLYDEDTREFDLYKKNIEHLEQIAPAKIPMERLHFGLNSTLAEEFMVDHVSPEGEIVKLNLQESFILWAKGETYASAMDKGYYWRGGIDFATANISQEEFPNSVSWYDIVEYIDKKTVKADRISTWNKDEDEIKADKAQARREAEEKRMARSETADKLFDRYLHEGLSETLTKKVEAEYNRRFNSYIIPDYSKLPLFIDGMSRTKNDKKFKLYEQQIKGVSFLCNKGNGLLAYDVGVGKTAAGIVATVNQIQTGRSKRPVIIVPNAVYAKWYKDISDLFPNIRVNDLYNLNKESTEKYRDKDNPHKLDIPENSISLITYEGLKNITFNDTSCENELFDDFSKLLSVDPFDGSSRENAKNADNIKAVIGKSSQVKNTNYIFYEDCGFDNITVDEAHNFKNLWTVPRPKNKGESNEFSGIPSGKPSARALKLFAMTQYTQRHNEDRNVFLLTATPFTNSPLEVYSMLSYVGRKRLIDSGLYSLRDFCNQFAHTKLELGVNSKGEIDQKQVMKDWKELPALQKILTEFIDKVDGEELKEIIRPKKFTHVQQIEMSPLQKQMMEIDTHLMNEVKEGNAAAVIVSMNAMRVGLVAPALADPARYPGLEIPSMEKLVETSPKLKFVCDSVIDMYKNHPEKGQFIFMPLGQTAHGIVKDYLVAHGIPKETVEIINGSINNTTEKKDKLTQKFNNPKEKCKILIGGKNTSEGIDLNGNSFVMYNCSLGWNPSETIQAEGRIWRQGNQQGHVHCVYPVMNDSIDSLLYQKHDEKRSRINELWTYKDGDTLNIEDINPEDLKFDLIKDPQKRAKLILENGIDTEEYKFVGTKVIQNELNKINNRIKSFDEVYEKQINLKRSLKETELNIQRYENSIEDYKNSGIDIPEWCKSELKDNRKYKTNYEHQLETIQRKFESWGIKNDDELHQFIPKLNSQKHELEKQLEEKQKELPKILKQETLKLNETKILLPSISEQRKILTEDIQNNLRPMSDVEPEIRTERFEQMLAQKWERAEITTEERELYSNAGYKKYYEWLDGETESLEVNEENPIKENIIDIQTEKSSANISKENDKKQEKHISLNYDLGLFPEDEIDELTSLSETLNPGLKKHQIIYYFEESGTDKGMDYTTLSEAQKDARTSMKQWELDKTENGFVVFNTETKEIEVVHGYFPVEKYFSSEILQANGYKVNESQEIQLSKIQDYVKEKLSEETSKKHSESLVVFATPEKTKKEYVDSYEW